MKIIDQIKQRRNLRSAWRAIRDASRPLTDDEINAIALDSARAGPVSDDFQRRWAETADRDASRHAGFPQRGTSPLACLYDWDYSGLPPCGNTDRRERLLSLAREAGIPSGTPGVIEFAELVMRQEPDTLV